MDRAKSAKRNNTHSCITELMIGCGYQSFTYLYQVVTFSIPNCHAVVADQKMLTDLILADTDKQPSLYF